LRLTSKPNLEFRSEQEPSWNTKSFAITTNNDSEKDLLGVGGFGRVYRAHDLLLGHWVALKALVPRRVHS